MIPTKRGMLTFVANECPTLEHTPSVSKFIIFMSYKFVRQTSYFMFILAGVASRPAELHCMDDDDDDDGASPPSFLLLVGLDFASD